MSLLLEHHLTILLYKGDYGYCRLYFIDTVGLTKTKKIIYRKRGE